jgi:hypothetical protein
MQRKNNRNNNRGNHRNNNNRGKNNRSSGRGRINVRQCIDKRDSYLNKARDSQIDRVEAEYFRQYADHFQRLINEYNAEQESRRQQEASDERDDDDDDDDDDEEDDERDASDDSDDDDDSENGASDSDKAGIPAAIALEADKVAAKARAAE